MQLPVIAGRYRILDRIGEGGLGVVYRVEDQATGEKRALKIIPRAAGRANLRGEFTALARLQHDNIVRVFDYGVTPRGEDWYTMELVEGRPLAECAPPAGEPAFYQLTGGVLRALAFLHARGLVHADVKPSNILVDAARLQSDPARAAKLCDFGLCAQATDPASAEARGTFGYAAPEVYAGRVDARSDLYALGVVLYELATGQKPYPGDDVADVVRRQRRGAPPDPRTIRPTVPSGLAELILALIEPEPGARLQTADEALARLNEFAGTDFAVAEQAPLFDLGGTLVGRERDLAQLNLLWEGARAHVGSVALIAGEEGIGKSRLLAELKLRVQLMGGRFYGASAAARAGEPYAGLAEIARALVADFGERQPSLVAPRRAAMAPILGERPTAQVEPSRFGAAEALTDLVMALAAVQPLVIVVDDLQLAERAALDLFIYLARAAWTGSLLLVGASRVESEGRPGEAGRLSAQLSHVERFVRLDLPPLDRASVRAAVAAALSPKIADSLSVELHRVSGGNPAFLGRAIWGLIGTGAIVRQRGHWHLVDATPKVPLPGDALAAARARAARLPRPAASALEVAAVLGERFHYPVYEQVLQRLGEEPSPDAIGALVAARLVEAEPGGGYVFAGAGLRDALVRSLPQPRRIELHRAAARVLTERQAAGERVPAAALAEHLVEIEDRDRALAAALAAADELAAALDHHGAIGWYARADALRGPDDRAVALAVHERGGDAHAAAGDIGAAVDAYQHAYALPKLAARDAVRLARKLAELHRRRGEGDDAIGLLMSALGRSRHERMADEEAACQLALARVRMYRSEYPAALEHAMAGAVLARAAGARELSALLAKTRADIETYRGDARAALDQAEAGLAEAATVGEATLADMLHTHGRACIHAGDYARAIESLEKAIAIDRRLGRVEQEAKALNNLGAACYFQGDWERARGSWERFRQLCERLDEASELVNALNNLGSLYRERGELSEALAVLDRGRVVADRTGHAHMAGTILGNRGETLFRRGDLAAARECYERCLALFGQLGAREDLIETKRRLCEVDVADGRLEAALERAIDAARDAQSHGARLEEAALHRVAAAALRLQGDFDTATWFLERSRELATKLGARYERAKVDLEEAELQAARGRTAEADACAHRAVEAFASLGARFDLARARERRRTLAPAAPATDALSRAGLGALLDVARAAGQVDLEHLLEVVLDKILEVTRFERGFILLLDERGRPTERKRRSRGVPLEIAFDRAAADFSGSIVKRVVQSGEPVTVTDVTDDAVLREQRSVVALGLRSVMCVPMRQKGRVAGIVYVDSRQLTEEDPAGDLSLLEALAAQASLAIENSRLMAEEQRKAELMAILAHEIRNPLAGILGYSELVPGERDEMPPASVELLDRIHRDAQRLKRLVDNVLELVRVEAGKIDWSMAPIRLGELLEDARSAYQPLAEQKQIAVEVSCPADLPPAFGNADRLFQVLSNLLGNALKFTPPGGKIVLSARGELVAPMAAEQTGWIALVGEEAPQPYVRVDVSDNGPGIPPERRDRLFSKFAQGEAGKKHSRGIGLGLFISREIVARHGGQIWVDSEPDKGSTFSFRIPAVP